MRQQVDLLQDGFVRPRVVLPPRQALAIVGAVVVCMILLHGLLAFEHLRAARQAQAVTGSIAVQQDALQRLRTAPAPGESAVLQARLAEAEAMLRRRQELLALVRAQDRPDAPRFSAYLRGLAEQARPGLWLTRIELRQGGESLSLQGRAVEAGLVPGLLQRLKAATAFVGKRFDDFRVNESSGGGRQPLQFELRSRPGADA